MNFLFGHECIFGPLCLFAHSIADVEEKIVELSKLNFYAFSLKGDDMQSKVDRYPWDQDQEFDMTSVSNYVAIRER